MSVVIIIHKYFICIFYNMKYRKGIKKEYVFLIIVLLLGLILSSFIKPFTEGFREGANPIIPTPPQPIPPGMITPPSTTPPKATGTTPPKAKGTTPPPSTTPPKAKGTTPPPSTTPPKATGTTPPPSTTPPKTNTTSEFTCPTGKYIIQDCVDVCPTGYKVDSSKRRCIRTNTTVSKATNVQNTPQPATPKTLSTSKVSMASSPMILSEPQVPTCAPKSILSNGKCYFGNCAEGKNWMPDDKNCGIRPGSRLPYTEMTINTCSTQPIAMEAISRGKTVGYEPTSKLGKCYYIP
jgi:hypothetical protein